MTSKMISTRVSNISESASVKLAGEIAVLRSKGERIIGLHIGEPDFLPEPQIASAITDAMNKGKVRYSQVAGEIALREAIIQSESTNSPVPLSMENIVVSNGSKQSLFNIFQTICDPGDEIIIPAPYWISFPESVKLAGGIPRFIDLDENLQPDLDQIKNDLAKRQKVLLLTTRRTPLELFTINQYFSKLAHSLLKIIFLLSQMKPTMDSFTIEMNTRHFITWIKHFFLTPLLQKPFQKPMQ